MTKTLIVGLLAAAAVPALAQTAAPAPAPMADKVITRADILQKVQQHFAKLDTNRDGVLSQGEVQAMASRHPGGAWRGENSAARDPNAMFNQLDANHDGTLSRDEFAKGHSMRIERRVVMNGQPGQPGQPGAPMEGMEMHRMGGHGGHGMGGMVILRMADLNHDGRITLQEAQSAAAQHFDQLDTNRDGRLTHDEMRAMHQKMAPMNMQKAG